MSDLREAILYGPAVVFPNLDIPGHKLTGPDVLDAVAAWMDRKDDEWEAERFGRDSVPPKANRDVQEHLREWARRLRDALAQAKETDRG